MNTNKNLTSKKNLFFDTCMGPSRLVLENGQIFPGYSPLWQTNDADGEVVFNTGMTGYCASLTDPSYAGQILCFTYPLIGNYGVPDSTEWESESIHLKGVIVSEACTHWSHHSGMQSLLDFLRVHHIPLITQVDTRHLTKSLRSKGVMLGKISLSMESPKSFYDPNKENLLAKVSIAKPRYLGAGDKCVIVVDCGIKNNILRCLLNYPIRLKQVPYNYDYTNESFDAVFISNGPGDPSICRETIAILQKAMKQEKPMFGICLGSQLMALAAGACTYKLPFGHRGHNQPCISLSDNKCYISSQNHGYAIDAASLPHDWKITFKNLNDQSIEGIAHRYLPFSAVQFHPEASPGPTDTKWLFETFYQSICHDSLSI